MSLSIPDLIPIEPLTQERPRGSPCGAQAYTTRLTAESFEAIKTALLVQERARTKERDISAKKGVPWATSKNEKHVVQLVVDEDGKTSMVVGDKTFPVRAVPEMKCPEIVARQTTPTHCDSDTGEMIPEHSSLHTIARVVGRLQVNRFLDDNNAAQVREYTKSHEKERNSTIVLGNDEYMAQQHKRSMVKVEAAQPPGSTATATLQPAPISSSNARSTKQSQASTSSAAPYLPVPDAEVPSDFKSLGLTIPRTWERENISLPLRTIHVMVLNKHTEAEISAEIEKYTGQIPSLDDLREILTRIALRDSSTGQWALRDPAYLYVRPFDYPDYDRSDRPAAVKATRPKLRALGYPDEGPRFEVLRRSTVLATPMVTSLSVVASENSGGVTTARRTVDYEALKRKAESNPAPVLKSDIRPGFFSSSTDTKKKKTSKTKEPKESKPKEPKESRPKKTRTKRDDPDMKPRAPREHEPSPTPVAPTSKATPKLEPEPYIDSKAPVVRALSRPAPGSAAGKLAAKKRLAEEAVMREKGILAESIQPPVLKSTPSKSAPATARSSPAAAPLKPSLKRKSASDFSESPPKRRKADMEEGEIDEATLPAAGKGKAKSAQRDDDDEEYDKFVAQSMKKRRSVSDDERPPPASTSFKKTDDAGVRASSKPRKQVVDDEYEDVKPARKKVAAASMSIAAKRRPTKEDDEYGSKSVSQRSVRWNTEVEEKSAAGIKKRKLALTQEDDSDYDDQRPKKKKKTVKTEPLESLTSSRPKQRASKADDEYDIKGRLERARETMPGAKRKADADPVAAIASPPLKLLKSDETLGQKAAKQSLRVAKAESPRVQPLKQSSTPAQPSGLRNLVASSGVEETKKSRKIKPEGTKPYAASPSGQLPRRPATKITNGKASASPAPISAAVQRSIDGKKCTPPPPPDPAADYATTVMNVINRQVPNTLEDLQSKFEGLIQADKALRIFLEFDQHELKEKRSPHAVLKPGAASLFQRIKRTHELRHKLTMETQKVAYALQQLGNINDANPVTTRQSVPRPDSPGDVISTRGQNLPVPGVITEEAEVRRAESKQRWADSSQPTTPHRTPLLLPSSVHVRSPTLVPVAAPPPASVPGPSSNHNPSSVTNTTPPTLAPARVSITPQESPTRSTPPAGSLPENKQSFQEVKTESKAFRRFRKVAPSASATPAAPGTPTVAGLQSQQALAYNISSPSGSGFPASAATPVTAAAPTPIANAATPAATAPTPGVAPSPVIPTVAVFSPVA